MHAAYIHGVEEGAGCLAAPPGSAAGMRQARALIRFYFTGTKFEHITVHIIQAPGVGLEAANGSGVHIAI